MSELPEQPTKQDAVLGGDALSPAQAAVLGGLGNVQLRLNSQSLAIKLDALRECARYGEQGIRYIIQALDDPLPRIQYEAYLLLRNRTEPYIQNRLHQHKFWQHFQRLYGLPRQHALMFANRKVEDFNPETGIQDPIATAYGLRTPRWSWQTQESIEDKLIELLLDSQAIQVEALVFGWWGYESSYEVVDCLLREQENLTNLTALFVGDIEDYENMISSIVQSELSYVLDAYPKLEILQIRGDARTWNNDGMKANSLTFSQLRHENLLALTIESGGLHRTAISGLCSLDLPALEYLELWLGSELYGGNSCIEDVMPIISGEAFPNLKYLGLRNSDYSDQIAVALAQSSLMDRLIELDLSLGTLSDAGAEALLSCSAIHSLATLDISDCYVHHVLPRFSESGCQVISDRQRTHRRPDGYENQRYCLVAE